MFFSKIHKYFGALKIGVFPKCFSLNSANSVTKKFVTLKGLEPATQPPLV